MTERNDRMPSTLQRSVDRLRTWSVVERLRRTPAKRALDAVYSLAAPVWFSGDLRPRARFIVREVTRRLRDQTRTWRYTIPRKDLVVWIRHNWIDAWIVDEIFGRGTYEPPSAVDVHLPEDQPLRVLDLGGNIGLFGLFALQRWSKSTVTSFEPDPANLEALHRNHQSSGTPERWTLVEAAAGPASGSLRFVSTGTGNAHVASGNEQDAIEVPMMDVFPYLDGIDLLKIDIEGGEWPIFLDHRFGTSGPRVMVAEYHEIPGLAAEPRTVLTDLLTSLGYTVHHLAARDASPSVGVVWAWQD